MTPTDFFQAAIGSKLGVVAGEGIKSVRIPQRVKVGVKALSIGQIDCFYIASLVQPSRLIGRIDLPSQPDLEFVGTEVVSARRFLAQWLLTEAKPPFIMGVISKAHPEPSYRISHHLAAVQFCDTSGNFSVNVETVREAFARIKHLDWKKTVAPAIHCYSDFRQADPGNNKRERDKLEKHLEKAPELARILPGLGVQPGSGEYAVFSWANIETRDKDD